MEYLGFASLAIVLATIVGWFTRAWRVNVPNTPYFFQATVGLGFVLGIVAFYIGTSTTSAGLAAGLAVLFVYLTATGAQKVRGATVGGGDTLPAFTAPDDGGHVFDSSSLSGSRVLLKFFRGHW
ncbi:MAG: hypothetical protein O7B25_09875 [Gammaproteobacteria bacterium]|nr:hypothetical protein [Gammaproteobacteria bacterium]